MITYIDAIVKINPNAEVSIIDNNYNQIIWHNIEPINKEILDEKISELETAEANEKNEKETLKASAKAKLIAGEALTEEEANTIVL
jgi:ribosomal protein L15